MKYEVPKDFPICKTQDLAQCNECYQEEDCSDECNCRCQDYTPYSDEEEKWEQFHKDIGLQQELGFCEVEKN